MSGTPRGRQGGDGDVNFLPIIGGLLVGSGILACFLVSKNPEVFKSFTSFIQDLLGSSAPCPCSPSHQKKDKKSPCQINFNKRKWLTDEEESERKAKLQAERFRKEREQREQELKAQKVREKQLLKEQQINQKQQRELQRHLNQQHKVMLRKENQSQEEQQQMEKVRVGQQQRKECKLQEQQQQVERLKEKLQHEQQLLDQMQRGRHSEQMQRGRHPEYFCCTE